jgi:Putative Ig domain
VRTHAHRSITTKGYRVIRTRFRGRSLLLGLLPAVPLLLFTSAAPAALAAPARPAITGSIHFDGSPGTSAPPSTLGPYTMTPAAADGRPLGSAVPNVTLPTGTMRFSPALTHLSTPSGGWATWSHGYTGDVYSSGGTKETLKLPHGTGAFYFYAEPNLFSTYTVQAIAQDGTSSGPVAVNGDAGATYLGFYGTGGASIRKIVVRVARGAGGFAVGEFGVAAKASFTSQPGLTVTYGDPFTFTVTTSSSAPPRLTKSGQLPPGVTFTDNRNGTATLAGTPSGHAAGVYPLTFYANGQGFARQAFSLTVDRAPSLRHTGTVRGQAGVALSQVIHSTAYPVATLAETGALPSGLNFTDNGDGTATIAGTPAAGSGGSYPVEVTASNGLGTASENFVVDVAEAPAITSADSAAASTGSAFSFAVTTTGFPAPSVTETGPLPKGVKFHAATGTFSGTPAAGTAGSYPVTLTAKNKSGTVTQAFTLIIS